jgi:hypothetical protein
VINDCFSAIYKKKCRKKQKNEKLPLTISMSGNINALLFVNENKESSLKSKYRFDKFKYPNY